MFTDRKDLEKRLGGLKEIRQPFEAEWSEISRFTQASRARFLSNDRDRNKRQWNTSMKDEHGLLSFRITAGGMNAGLTSSSRPWFKLATYDEDLIAYPEHREYLVQVERAIYAFLAQTNFYRSMKSVYSELPLFGTAVNFMQAHDEKGMIFHPQTVGEYWVAVGETKEIDTLYREVPLSVKQAVDMFGKAVSPLVQSCYDSGEYDTRVDVIHAVQPNIRHEEGKLGSFAYESIYWDVADTRPGAVLSQSGYNEKPFMAPRWDIIGSDAYGFCPGMDSLASLRELQLLVKRRNEAIDNLVKPEKIVPPNVKLTGRAGNIVSASAVDAAGVIVPYTTPYQAVAAIKDEIRDVKQMISDLSFANLFNAITNMEGIQPRNVEEIQSRNEEKFTQLMQVVDSVNTEGLEVCIDRVFSVMQRGGLLPEPPEAMQDVELKVDFVSVLTQMQRAVGISQIERTTAFVGNLAGMFPEAADKLNVDELIDEYADAAGTSPAVINGEKDVAKIREAKAQAAQQARMMEAMPAVKQGVEAAALMAEVAPEQSAEEALI